MSTPSTHCRLRVATVETGRAIIERYGAPDGVTFTSVVGTAVDLMRLVLIDLDEVEADAIPPGPFEAQAHRLWDRVKDKSLDARQEVVDLANTVLARANRYEKLAETALATATKSQRMAAETLASQERMMTEMAGILNSDDGGE